MAKAAKKTAQKQRLSFKRRTALRTARLACKPHALMGCVLLGLVACSSGNNSHHSGDYSGGYSPFGGTENPTAVKLGKAYTVNGTTYYPRAEPHYSETGIASWYGPTFHGRETASGEQYDQHEMTAAHRTLPLPSMVRVTRMDTGASIIVRINDRGPFASNRIIDLSKEAASSLDMIRHGTAKVKVEYLPAETRQYVAGLGLDIPDYMMADASDAEKADLKLANVASSRLEKHGVPHETKNAGKQLAQAESKRSAERPDVKPALRLADSSYKPEMIKAEELPPVTSQKVQAHAIQTASLDTKKSSALKVAPSQAAAQKEKPAATTDLPATKVAAADLAEHENVVHISFHPGKPSAPLALASFVTDSEHPAFGATPTIMSDSQQFKVQTAAFSNLVNAKKHVEELGAIGKARIMPISSDSGTVYRVILGPVNGYHQAMSILRQTKDMGYKDARIMVE